jgi:predicted nucleic acid-binding protein
MRAALFDSTVYITAMRRGNEGALALRHLSGSDPVWLSAVVLEELYAGASERARPAVEQIERDFSSNERILIPNLTDWTEAGRVLERVAAKYDYEAIGRGRLTNDALIATSAARSGVRVITANERDFRRLAEFQAFELELTAL